MPTVINHQARLMTGLTIAFDGSSSSFSVNSDISTMAENCISLITLQRYGENRKIRQKKREIVENYTLY